MPDWPLSSLLSEPHLNPSLLRLCCCVCLLAISQRSLATEDYNFVQQGEIDDPELAEVSGLAVSHRDAALFWVINDSGNPAVIYALDRSGKRHGSYELEGLNNHDFEDLVSYVGQQGPMLAVADCGDNLRWRRQIQLHVLAEPDPHQNGRAPVLRSYRLRYPDGARDCESLAYDPRTNEWILLEKAAGPSGVYALNLQGDAELRRIATLPERGLQPAPLVLPFSARYRGALSAADISADGCQLLALTLSHVLIYRRRLAEPWEDALQRAAQVYRLPLMRQPEAAAFDQAGKVWVTGEQLPAPLLELQGPASPATVATGPSASSAPGSNGCVR